jgi:DNA-binding transcriptional LysR family regulator
MNLNHLNIFYAVAEEGSVSRGAGRLCISQPAVSKQLAEFERALGAPLFDRLPRGVRLTEAGRLLHLSARRLFAIEADAERSLRELRGLEQGRLAIGASTSIGAYLLPPILAAFYRAYPRVELHLQISNTEIIQDALEAGALDVGFTEGLLPFEGLDATVCQEDELVFIAAPGYAPLAQEPGALTLKRVCAEPLLIREAGSGTRAVVAQALEKRGITVRPAMTLGNTEAIKRAVAEGVGVAVVSRLTIRNEVRAGQLVVLHLTDFTLRRPLHQLRVHGRHPSSSLQAFLNLFHATLQGG